MNYQNSEPIKIVSVKQVDNQALDDAQTVLNSLGYERKEIEDAMSKALTQLNNPSAEDILKESLKILSL